MGMIIKVGRIYQKAEVESSGFSLIDKWESPKNITNTIYQKVTKEGVDTLTFSVTDFGLLLWGFGWRPSDNAPNSW